MSRLPPFNTYARVIVTLKILKRMGCDAAKNKTLERNVLFCARMAFSQLLTDCLFKLDYVRMSILLLKSTKLNSLVALVV